MDNITLCITFLRSIRNRLLGGAFRTRLSDGSSNRTTHSGMVRLDDSASPSEISVLHIQDRVSAGSGFRCVPRSLVGPSHSLTPHSPHFLTDFSYETHPDIGGPSGPSVSRTRIRGNDGRFGVTGRSSLQEVLRCSLHGEGYRENTRVGQEW